MTKFRIASALAVASFVLAACSGGSQSALPSATLSNNVRTPASNGVGNGVQAPVASPASLKFTALGSANAQTFIVTVQFAGDLTAVSSNTDVATVGPSSVSPTVTPNGGGTTSATFTVTPTGAGTATITVTDKKGAATTVKVAVSSVVSYVDTVLADHPGVYLRMNDTAAELSSNGYIKDWSGNGLNSQTFAPASTIASDFGVVSGPIYYPADTAIAYASNAESATPYGPLSTGYSAEFWINTTVSTPVPIVASNGRCANSFRVTLNDNYLPFAGVPNVGRVAVTFAEPGGNWPSAGITSSTTINDGAWHHVVATWSAPSGTPIDGTQLHVFIDGVDVTGASFAVNGSLGWASPIPVDQQTQSGYCLTPGSTGVGQFLTVNGGASGSSVTLDEVAAYPYALTPAQILTHYNVGKFGHL